MKKIVLSCFLAALCSVAWAWPTKPITLIVPYAAGGPADLQSRAMAKELQRLLGQTVVVQIMTGGNQQVAHNYVLNNPNDNHTFIWSNNNLITTPLSLNTKDYEKFTVTNVQAIFPLVVWGGSNTSVEQFQHKIRQGQIVNIGSFSTFHQQWLTNLRGGLNVNHVSYKGVTPLALDMASGVLEYGFSSIMGVQALLAEGKIRPIMISGNTRASHLPQVPTFLELGLQGDPMIEWTGYIARNDTHPEAVRRFSAAIRQATRESVFMQNLGQQGLNVVNLDQPESARFVDQQLIRAKKYQIIPAK